MIILSICIDISQFPAFLKKLIYETELETYNEVSIEAVEVVESEDECVAKRN